VDTGAAEWGRPLYERVLEALGEVSGGALLDVGCGTGELCRLAADRGLAVRGVDVDRAALDHAARLVPEGEFTVGHLPGLPLPDRAAAAVACLQVLMHVPNPLAALRELARVARPGAPVVVTVWGPPEQCAVGAFGRALAPLLGAGRPAARTGPVPGRVPTPAGGPVALAAPTPPALSAPGRLARLAGLAGLEVTATLDVGCAFDYPDERALLAGLYAAELGRRAVARAGRAPVRRAVLAGLAAHRTEDGGYRLDNTFRLLAARAAPARLP
jgi:SAM-dependent methyltransferase